MFFCDCVGLLHVRVAFVNLKLGVIGFKLTPLCPTSRASTASNLHLAACLCCSLNSSAFSLNGITQSLTCLAYLVAPRYLSLHTIHKLNELHLKATTKNPSHHHNPDVVLTCGWAL